ncbi:MAG: T9SS type A sorting domain-containing protein [Bacteroidota bacterium]|nr:T9SS type A sorting domain-containing protein [Bacteroidota bacterium]
MKTKLLSLFLFILLLQSNTAKSQIDTSFWFAAPWITPDHWWKDDIKLHISTFSTTTTVRLRQPGAIAPNRYDTTIIIPPYTTFNYVFWRDKLASATNFAFDSLETRPANTVVPYGLYISSSANITVVYDILTRAPSYINGETFSLKGQNGLGLHFLCPFQTKLNNQTLGFDWNTDGIVTQPKQQINIVASQPNTIVIITPKCNIVGHLAGITYTLLLNNPGDAYTLENTTQTVSISSNNLSGTEISSNKPISVTVADDSVRGISGGCYDLAGDQIVPSDIIGTDYVLIKGFMNAPELEGVYVLASQNSTSITINDGIITNTVINQGNTYFYKTNQQQTYVSSSSPVYCIQLTGYGCEYGEAILPPINCAGSNLISFSRNTNQNFLLNIVCKNSALTSFSLNNSSGTVTVPITASNFTVIPGTSILPGGPFFGSQINLSPTLTLPTGSYSIANTADVFGLGVFEGNLSTSGWYYNASSFLRKTNVVAQPSTNICVSSSASVALTGTVSGAAITGTWSTANGTGAFGAYTSTFNTITAPYYLSNADTLLFNLKFYITAIDPCGKIYKDSTIVSIDQRPHVIVSASYSVCDNISSIPLTGTVTNAFGGSWSGGSGGSFLGAGITNTYIPTLTDVSLGYINFTLTSVVPFYPSCLNTSNALTVTLLNSPSISIVSSSSLLCVGQSATLTAGGASTYTWNTGYMGSIGVVTPPVGTTNYTIAGTNSNGCYNSSIYTQSVSLCTGLNSLAEALEATLQIFPNPTKGILNVISTSSITDIQILNTLGQVVYQSNHASTPLSVTVNIQQLSNGIYFVKVLECNKVMATQKIIKE